MISPVDIQNKEFNKVKIGGYNPNEVNAFLDEVLDAYQQITKENYELRDKVNMLNENIQYYRTMESTIQNALVLAEKTAQDTKTLAYDKADQIKKEAEQKAETIVAQAKQDVYTVSNQIEDLKKQYLSFKVQVKQVLQGQLEIMENQKISFLGEEIDTVEPLAEENRFYTREFKVLDEDEA